MMFNLGFWVCVNAFGCQVIIYYNKNISKLNTRNVHKGFALFVVQFNSNYNK